MKLAHCCLIPLFACSAALAQIADSPDDSVANIPVNYTEAKVGSYTLPDLMKLADSRPVRDAARGWRRDARKSSGSSKRISTAARRR